MPDLLLPRVRPLRDHILVRPMDWTEHEKTVIQLVQRTPDRDKKREMLWAEVIAVGPEQDQVKVGDQVPLGCYQGTTIHLDGKDYVMLTGEEIRAVREMMGASDAIPAE